MSVKICSLKRTVATSCMHKLEESCFNSLFVIYFICNKISISPRLFVGTKIRWFSVKYQKTRLSKALLKVLDSKLLEHIYLTWSSYLKTDFTIRFTLSSHNSSCSTDLRFSSVVGFFLLIWTFSPFQLNFWYWNLKIYDPSSIINWNSKCQYCHQHQFSRYNCSKSDQWFRIMPELITK